MCLRGLRLRLRLRGGRGVTFRTVHRRCERQARWFSGERSRLLRRADILRRRAVLDLGCGTGVVTRELRRRCEGRVAAADPDGEVFETAPGNFEGVERFPARAEDLPFADGELDLVFTQMLFLWVRDPSAALREISRVLEPGGTLIAAAEPDYGGRIEHPEGFALTETLREGLRAKGADPAIGRKLRGLMLEAGFEVEAGLHASMFSKEELAEALDEEYAFAEELSRPVAKPRGLEDDPALFLHMPYFHFYGRKR